MSGGLRLVEKTLTNETLAAKTLTNETLAAKTLREKTFSTSAPPFALARW